MIKLIINFLITTYLFENCLHIPDLNDKNSRIRQSNLKDRRGKNQELFIHFRGFKESYYFAEILLLHHRNPSDTNLCHLRHGQQGDHTVQKNRLPNTHIHYKKAL